MFPVPSSPAGTLSSDKYVDPCHPAGRQGNYRHSFGARLTQLHFLAECEVFWSVSMTRAGPFPRPGIS